MIILHTLGDTLITIGDRKIRPSSPLVFASLLYLATERGRRVPRTALQELLFPEAGERSGAHSLRQLLYKLRQLGAPLEADATSVYLSADHVRDDAATTGASHSAVVSFLPDFEPDISERYNEWLEQKRAEFAASIRKRLVASIEANRESLNWQAVERDAQLLLSVDPFNEVGTFALAEAAALQGGKAAALRILSEYERETGRTDLRLPASLLRRRISQAVPDTPVPTLSALPFVGRDAEVKELRRYIARARAGQPCLYVIGGEAGIGKTRLLTEVAALAALEGMGVFTVRCQSHYASRPLSVFIELVPALLNARGALGIAPQSLASLNRLTNHRDDVADRPADYREDVTRSELLLTAIRDLVDAVASEQSLLVAVEDAHWADHDSLRELNRLVQGVTTRSTIFVCTTRSQELLPVFLQSDDCTVCRRLKPLPHAVMGRLADGLLRRGSDAMGSDLVQWSVRTAGGNPLFLQMLCSHYAATGEAFVVPHDVLSAVSKRVEQLPESAQRLLALCALLGRYATADILRDITQWTRLQLLDVTQRLEIEGYIFLVQDAVCISHDLVGQAAVASLPPVSRRLLHGCVASALESRFDLTNDAALLWDCTEHWVLSGEIDKATQFLVQCAQHATYIGRANDAIRLLERAAKLVKFPNQEIAVLRESLLAARSAGRWQACYDISNRLEVLADPQLREHCDHEIICIEAEWMASFQATKPVRRLQACLDSNAHAHKEHRVDAAYALIRIAHETARPDLAHAAFAAVNGICESMLQSHSALMLPLCYHSLFGDLDEALSLSRVAIQRLKSAESLLEELRCATSLASLLVMLGDPQAIDLCGYYYQKCGNLGLPSRQLDFALGACTAHALVEEYSQAEDWHRIAARVLAADNTSPQRLRHLSNEMELAIGRKDIQHADQFRREIDLRKIGDSLRGRSYFLSADVRIRQIDATYQTDEDSLETLRVLHVATCRLYCADGLTIALGESLLRRGRIVECESMLRAYVREQRRERSTLPPSLASLFERACREVASPAAQQQLATTSLPDQALLATGRSNAKSVDRAAV